ncbi:hypothetical protein LRP31_35005 (plasmid) [Mesorhizobium mediterraneum]|nr:nucleotidyltransferase [Mesorhizobium mediterraneum]WIW57340.1 hypothetical protein LRP31_35005 [Mesorhizobium mediterraneum]
MTDDQFNDGWTKHINIGRTLERAYYGTNGEFPPAFMVGSWGKQTQVRPPRDLDAFFVMPQHEKARFDARAGNVQSALLQEVKEALRVTYPNTEMRGDGQVVAIAFNTITVEVLPVFATEYRQYWMPDTHDGGSWKVVDPFAQIGAIETADKAMNGNVRALSKMMKLWKRERNVPLKSFVIELLIAEFLPARGYGGESTFWYDYYVRDFLSFLISKANAVITIPGTFEPYFLGSEWLPKAIAARDIALAACHWEYSDFTVSAGQEWQKIFGPRIAVHVT